MSKKDFFKKNDEKFLPLGFIKEENDPQFYYSYPLISNEIADELGLDEEYKPALLIGNTGINKGSCIYTGEHFIWFASESPEDAIAFAKKITAFESV